MQRAGELSLSLLAQPVISASTMTLLLSGLQIMLIGMMSDGLARRLERRVPTMHEALNETAAECSQPHDSELDHGRGR